MSSSLPINILHGFLLSLGPGLPLLMSLGLAYPRVRRSIYLLAPLAALPALLVSFWGPAEVTVEVPWFFMGGRMGIDTLGRSFLFFTSLLWLITGAYARSYLRDDIEKLRFFIFHLLAMAGNFGLILAQDMLSFYLFFTLMSFSAYGLVIFHGTEEARRAGRIYLGLVILGELLLFAAMILIAASSKSLVFTEIILRPDPVLLVLLFLGFGIKAGALPLHFWLPLAHPVAPAPASAVLSGAMIKAGLLGWLRFLPPASVDTTSWGILFLVAGFLAAFYGVAIGLTRRNPKVVLAYSSISQMGLMTVIIGSGLLTPAVRPQAAAAVSLYAIHHGLAKASLFLGVGVARHGWGKRLSPWWFRAGLILPCLALAGLPLTNGAVAKAALKGATAQLAEPWNGLCHWLLPLAAVGTTILLCHFVKLAWQPDIHDETPDPGLSRIWLINLLCVAALCWIWPEAYKPARLSLQPAMILHGLWPVAAGILLGAVLIRFSDRHRTAKATSAPVAALADILKSYFRRQNILPCLDRIRQTKQTFRGIPFIAMAKIPTHLRKSEKILGRWSMVGLLYLGLLILFITLVI